MKNLRKKGRLSYFEGNMLEKWTKLLFRNLWWGFSTHLWTNEIYQSKWGVFIVTQNLELFSLTHSCTIATRQQLELRGEFFEKVSFCLNTKLLMYNLPLLTYFLQDHKISLDIYCENSFWNVYILCFRSHNNSSLMLLFKCWCDPSLEAHLSKHILVSWILMGAPLSLKWSGKVVTRTECWVRGLR